MTPEEFREIGHQLIDWIADYRGTVADAAGDGPHRARRGRAQLPGAPPDQPEGFDAVFRDLERIIVPGLSHWQHPQLLRLLPVQRLAGQRPGRLTSAPAWACSGSPGSRARP